jgi:signal transduction histidine kinase
MADSSHSENEKSDYSIRIVLSPLRYLRDVHGFETLDRVLSEAGLTRAQFEEARTWLSLEQVVGILQAVRDIAGSDEAFKKACVHRMSEAYGPLRFALRALSPRKVFELAASNIKIISNVSRAEVVANRTSGSFDYRAYSSVNESRLMCLGRQAQAESLPGLWGLPPAQIRERSCIARGDPCCEYEVRTFQPRGLLKPLVGGVLGAGAALAAVLPGLVAIPAGTLWFALPALGFLIGHLIELRRTNSINLHVAEEMNEELRRALRENAEAQREIIDLHGRQQEWNRRLEEQVAERAQAQTLISDRLQSLLKEQNFAVREVSHDLKNPFQVILHLNYYLGERLSEIDPDCMAMVRDQRKEIDKVKKLLIDLMKITTVDPLRAQLRPETMDVPPLEESYRRRLRALVGDRGIRVSVLPVTREAPQTIVVDRMVMDRVVDNLMSNAVKYTERGSIVLELDGKPGFLTVKISDTGRGIAEADIDRIFRPGGSDPVRRVAESHGLGLSVVVRLLDRIGGQLEVMSKVGQGSTFWAHFPLAQAVSAPPAEPAAAPEGDPTTRVLTIRKAG